MTALVAGGGPAGAAAAIALARAGHRVRLVERTTGPTHKVCGEFLSWETCRLLAGLGVEPAALGAAAIDHVRLATPDGVARAPLGFRAWSLTRRVLDEALLASVAAAGAVVERGVSLVEVGAGMARLADGRVHRGPLVLATGKHDVRGAPRPRAGALAGQIALKTYWRLTPGQERALAGHVELLLFPGGYGGLQPVEGGRANLTMLVDPALWDGEHRRLLARLGGLLPHLARRLDGARPLLARPLAVARMPYGWVAGAADGPEGVWRAGDQAHCIPSFTGDGMALALWSGGRVARALAAGDTRDTALAGLGAAAGPVVRRAALVQRWASRRGGRALAGHATRLWPGLLTLGARATRLGARAL